MEIPDALFAEAKALALRRKVTLKTLLTHALERELKSNREESTSPGFRIDESGWPVLEVRPDDSRVVTDAFVNELRESEGV